MRGGNPKAETRANTGLTPAIFETGTRGLWIDIVDSLAPSPKVDDFLVAVSKVKSGTVYHVATIRQVKRKMPTARRRFAMRVFVVPFEVMLKRDRSAQAVFPLHWYPRKRRA